MTTSTPLSAGTPAPRYTVNQRGEIKGFGPRWSCDSFGEDRHDYYLCPHCMGNYLTWLSDTRAGRQVPA